MCGSRSMARKFCCICQHGSAVAGADAAGGGCSEAPQTVLRRVRMQRAANSGRYGPAALRAESLPDRCDEGSRRAPASTSEAACSAMRKHSAELWYAASKVCSSSFRTFPAVERRRRARAHRRSWPTISAVRRCRAADQKAGIVRTPAGTAAWPIRSGPPLPRLGTRWRVQRSGPAAPSPLPRARSSGRRQVQIFELAVERSISPLVTSTSNMRDGGRSISPRDQLLHPRSGTSASASPLRPCPSPILGLGRNKNSGKRAAKRARRRMRTGSSRTPGRHGAGCRPQVAGAVVRIDQPPVLVQRHCIDGEIGRARSSSSETLGRWTTNPCSPDRLALGAGQPRYSSWVSGCRNTGKSRPTGRNPRAIISSGEPPTTTQSRSVSSAYRAHRPLPVLAEQCVGVHTADAVELHQ